ncbi:glycoside hydrolase family 99-like domain-containing protein [Agrilutibacter solisilvae]|uniref:Glycoside hydrolase family 99-like domain-containing protein n=1 Tax=Agrilutibacter solisilvae TaxID=2763317 RepID=A0A974Y1F5_9GAMM|nr:glycoside hydrolase family 99-like domain-containing protein [Lysobacter solisilvae]QSX79647.1 glycoside hydrolase family 99-like domain-containing protein [Lysobacter solisilvae]
MNEMEDNVKLIRDSGIFDEQWYLTEYPDVLALGLSPAQHYLTIGAQLGRHPGPAFDAAWYLSHHKDVAQARMNPLLHYLTYGRFEGREIRGLVVEGKPAAPAKAVVAQDAAASDPDASFTLLPAAAGRMPDLFRLRAMAPAARIAIVTYTASAAAAASVDAFLQQQAEPFDHIDMCPTSMPLRSRPPVAARCKRKVTLVYPDRHGPAAPFVHLVDSGVLSQYDAVCWLVRPTAGEPIVIQGADRIAGLVRDQGDIGLVSDHIWARSDWGGPEARRLLSTFLPRLGRKLPAQVVSGPIGDVIWINPLLLRQLRAVPVRPEELLNKEGNASEAGRHALQALLAVFAAEGDMAVINCDAAAKRLPPAAGAVVPARTAAKQRKVKAIAFYLPQYHPIPQNDLWWGKGFTEWNNVVRARPMFRGHYQPRVPADLGYYDLRLDAVREHQARLAQANGVHGLCYYYYWFNGQKLLNQPIEQMLASGTPNLPFCVCWANENWSRNWDGQNRHVLLEQQYSMESNRAFIREMIPMMKDPRYIRHHGKPVLVVYRIRVIPNWLETVQMWREECRRAGIGEIHLCAVRFGLEPLEGPPAQFGVDSYVLFPPHETRREDVRSEQVDMARHFNGELFSYDAVVDGDITRFADGYPWPVHRGAMMGWDNTARRLNDSRIFAGSTPTRFRYWLKNIIDQENQHNRDDESLLFINAWNEWAEGTYLEPDQRFGTGYLSAVKSALAGCDTGPVTVAPEAPVKVSVPAPKAAVLQQVAPLPGNVKKGVAVKPAWHAGDKSRIPGAPTVLLCAHISGHQLFGGERSFLDVLDAMGRMQLNVVVTLPSGNNTAYVEEVRKRSLGVHVFAYPQWVADRPVDEALTLVFADIIARHDVDIVHANTIVLLEPLAAARRMGRKGLVHSRELITLDESLRERIGLSSQEIIRRVFAISDYVIGNSLATVAAFRREGRTFYVNNAVRPDDLDLANKVGKTVRFAVVSSNIPKKGVADFLEVARLCEGRVDNAQFLVIGPENKQIEEWREAQQRGEIPASVKFMGYRDTPRQAMVEAHVVLNLSSFAESFGRTVAEALAARRPVIAYEWGALPELIEHGVIGYLAPYRDTQAVADHVVELCRDPARIVEMGEKGRAAMQAGFTPDALHDRLLDAYQSIFARPLEGAAAAAAPTDAASTATVARARNTTIVVPVYNACDEVRACLDSLVRNTDLSRNRVIVINDGSTDPRVAQMLEEFNGKPGITLRPNPGNLGYTRTVNIGLREAGDDDVVLLNSDTVVTPQWLEGLRSTAYADAHAGTVTAMSDNAGAFSFPVMGKANPKPAQVSHDDYAATIVQKAAACEPVEVPTGSGFCMFIRRDLVAQIGEFDEQAFPRGYGEENDFCMRAMKAGWRNLITPRSFVFHVRSASFGDEKAKLVQAGVDVVTRRYPEYSRLTREAFASPQIRALHNAVASAVAAIGDGAETATASAPAAQSSTAPPPPTAVMRAAAQEERWLKILTGELVTDDAPVMPDEKYQRITSGRDGRRIMTDALMFRNFMKSLLAEHARPLAADTRILEFGCGWGRILRTFLDEVSPEYLVGIDAQEWMLDVARQTTRRPGYDMYWRTEALPQGDLPAESFDLIYAYSVFSHLSEKAANAWIAEFARILAPGGLVCVTTRPRKHMQVWENAHEHTEHTDGYAKVFANAQRDLERYDRGEFIFHPGGSHELKDELYGEAVVPEAYARKHWTKDLEFVGYFEDYAKSYLQPAIVLRKKR